MNLLPGTIQYTSDGVVGTSGKPIRIFSVVVHSAGAGASTPVFCNGTDNTTAWFRVDGIADQDVIVNFAGGIRFPNGCYIDTDGNLEYATVTFTQEF